MPAALFTRLAACSATPGAHSPQPVYSTSDPATLGWPEPGTTPAHNPPEPHAHHNTPHAPVLDTIHQLHILVAHAGRTTFLHAHTHREHISSLHALLLDHETHAPNAIRGNPSRREAHMKTHKSGSNTPHTCSRRRPPPLRPPRASPSPPAGLTGTREAYGPTNEPPGLKLNEPKRL